MARQAVRPRRLAAGLTALEIGSDIGGSIRNPAHFCGVFGHKPTYRLIPARGHAPPGVLAEPEIAVVGPIARSAADLDLALDVLAKPDRLETGLRYDLPRLGGRRLKDLKVAVWANDDVAPVSRDVRTRRAESGRRAAPRRHPVNDDARPAFSAALSHATYQDLLFRVPVDLGSRSGVRRTESASDEPRARRSSAPNSRCCAHKRWITGAGCSMNEAREKLRWAWRNFFDEYDVLVAPIMATAAFPHDHGPMDSRTIDVDGSPRPYFEQVFWAGLPGVAYLPATVIPTGNNAAGLPIGVQIIGPAYGDRITVGVARLLEAEGFAFTPPPAYA